MSFPFLKLSAAATIPAAEQLTHHVAHLESEPSEGRLFELVSTIRNEKDEVTRSLSKGRKGELTEELDDSDTKFDESFEIFRDSAEITARRTSRAKQSEAAGKVVNAIDSHDRNLHRLSRQVQVGRAESLIVTCETPEMQENLTVAGIMADFEEMRDNLQELKHLLTESSRAEADKNTILPPYKAGRALARSLGDLYSYVEIFARIGNEEYQSILNRMDETLEKFRPML